MIEIKRIDTQKEFNDGIKALTEIFIDEYPYYETWINKNLVQFTSGEKQILSIFNENELLGYLMIHFCTNEIVKINGIYVFEQYKGKGIATEAINKLIKLLKELNVKLVFIQTRLDNNAVVHLFDKTSFQLIGTNYHSVECKNNWVACNNISPIQINEQEIALQLYNGFCPLTSEEILKLLDEHKNANLVLKKTKRN